MKRLSVAGGLLLLLAVPAVPAVAEARATFDAKSASLRLSRDAVRTFDFELPETLLGAELVTWDKSSNAPKLGRLPIASISDVASLLTSGPDDAVEGSHALRLGKGGTGLLLSDPALFEQVRQGRFEATLWARGDGTSMQLHVIYDKDPANVYAGGASFATLRAIRTGRQTTDGWAEYSTGPIDGNVWGVPVRGLAILPSYYGEDEDSFLVDALEISKAEGKVTEPALCTQQNVDAACGPEGDCMFGHCVSSTVTWGVLPPRAHRREIAERWITYGTRLIGDRNAAKNGVELLTPQARALAESAASSRQFFGGMSRLVNLLRDNHTSFGTPSNFTSFAPQISRGGSSALGACFGVVDKDLLGGGLGYAVFRASASPLTGVPLQRGDVVFAIDGREPKQWVDENWARFATTLPNDPGADWGPSANDLSRLVSTRASNITLLRCASQAQCGPGSRQQITVDVAGPMFKALTGEAASANETFGCTQRFSNSVTPQGGVGGMGEDPVYVAAGQDGETRVQFDGFVGGSKWNAAFTNVFSPRPSKVLMDARMGHGGYYDSVQKMFDLLRGTSEPIGVLSFGRGTYDLTDPPWLFDRLTKCTGDRGDFWTCFQGNANGFFSKVADPPGGATRIAWLNTYDVSANDFMPKLLKGRTGVKIFAPHPTSGAFGAVSELPGIASGWSGGSLQVQDAKFATDSVAAKTARWESGHGVEPDVVVAEKLSDAIAGIDTILQAAATWLQGP
jgi:hypothetical protein